MRLKKKRERERAMASEDEDKPGEGPDEGSNSDDGEDGDDGENCQVIPAGEDGEEGFEGQDGEDGQTGFDGLDQDTIEALIESGVELIGPQSKKAREIFENVRQVLVEEPNSTINYVALKTGHSNPTVGKYFPIVKAAIKAEKLSKQLGTVDLGITHADVVLSTVDRSKKLELLLDALQGSNNPNELRAIPAKTLDALFRGYGTLERYLRLQAELLGRVSPPKGNLLIQQIQQILNLAPGQNLPKGFMENYEKVKAKRAAKGG